MISEQSVTKKLDQYSKKRRTLFGVEGDVYRDFAWFRSDTLVVS